MLTFVIFHEDVDVDVDLDDEGVWVKKCGMDECVVWESEWEILKSLYM